MSPRSGVSVTPQVFQIMLSLAGGDLHGYALMQDIEQRTDGEVTLTASTLYGAIRRMRDAGWIEERSTDDADERRRVYRLTRAGRVAAGEEAVRLEAMAREARRRRLFPSPRRS